MKKIPRYLSKSDHSHTFTPFTHSLHTIYGHSQPFDHPPGYYPANPPLPHTKRNPVLEYKVPAWPNLSHTRSLILQLSLFVGATTALPTAVYYTLLTAYAYALDALDALDGTEPHLDGSSCYIPTQVVVTVVTALSLPLTTTLHTYLRSTT